MNSELHKLATIVAITEKIPLPSANPYTLFRSLDIERGYILESMEGMPRRAVRSIIGLEPELVLTLKGDIGLEGREDLSLLFSTVEGADPISQLRDISSRLLYEGSPEPGFFGGFVGYCAYDMVTGLTRGLVKAGSEESPLARFLMGTRGIVYDHVQRFCLLFDDLVLFPDSNREEEEEKALRRIRALKERIESVEPDVEEKIGNTADKPLSHTTTMSRLEYQEAIRKAKDHIRAGDIFQVVLSRRIACPYHGDPLKIYGAIRAINPSPYLFYLNFGDEIIIGSSPEMLVKVEGKTVQTVPIAGTRPRGRDSQEDDLLAMELLEDRKENAEHLMLVDLARNDIGRVADFGSVKVPEFMEIERFSHVQHIVSRVCGRLRKDCDRFDALAACFPAGTVSGAPKIRAMQIIAELEAHPRGLYAGAVGYSGFNDLLEYAIAIRTLRVSEERVEFSTGAGIVADSIPEREFEETEYKAQAMMKAVLQAGDI
ncbi:MAG TPA: anthranilate synthase component I family protein [Methanoregulaceae archaeon]|nr:anthranilate synthase component I family protein [Methanoregulaceae archaeon]